MLREAEAIEQQMRGPTAAAAPAPGGSQAPSAAPNGTQNGGGADYSAQWAEYYRSIGKVKEAETIEAQMKQKVAAAGPYGGQAYYGGQAGGPSPGAPAAPQPAGSSYPGYPAGYQAYGGQPGADS
jgi:far upstream element-binding protein